MLESLPSALTARFELPNVLQLPLRRMPKPPQPKVKLHRGG